jgi:SAM-dependent methyltransferase
MHPESKPTPPEAILFQLLTGKWVSAAISAVARLGIADQLESGPKTAAALAASLKMNPGALYRLLRATASVGVFEESGNHEFSQTPMSRLLRTNAQPCLRNIAMMLWDDWSNKIWGELLWSVETGRPAPFKVFGMPGFEWFSKNPDQAVNFNNAMTDLSSTEGPAVASSYDFSGFERIVDIGGGLGGMLAAILESTPRLHGTLFDLPYVIEQARTGPILAPFSGRCDFVSGSFLEGVPAGAGAYIMKHIIHDWDDENSIKILSNCRQAMRPGGKILVVDRVLGPPNQPDPGKFMDLEMLVAPGGKERDEPEWHTLFAAAGLRVNRILPTPSPHSIIEGVPA